MNKFLRVMRETGGKGATGWKDGRALLARSIGFDSSKRAGIRCHKNCFYYVLSEGGL